MADPVDDADIVKYFKNRPITKTGLRLIRAAMILERADLLDTLSLLIKKGMTDTQSELATIKKAIALSEMMRPDVKMEPEPKQEEKKILSGGRQAGKKSVFGISGGNQ